MDKVEYGSGHDKYTVAAAVAHAISGRPLDFEDATKHILAAKLQAAVEDKREAIAGTLFGKAGEEPEAEVETPEVEEEAPVEESETPEVEEDNNDAVS